MDDAAAASTSTTATATADTRVKKKRKYAARIPPCRIKRVMQMDEEIGRMSASAPVVLGRAMEHFAERLLQAAGAVAAQQDARTLNVKHMKEAVHRQGPEFSLLVDLVENVPMKPSTSATPAGSVKEQLPKIRILKTVITGWSPGTSLTGLRVSATSSVDSEPSPALEDAPDGPAFPDGGRRKLTLGARKRRKQEKVEEEEEPAFAVPGAPVLKRVRAKEELPQSAQSVV